MNLAASVGILLRVIVHDKVYLSRVRNGHISKVVTKLHDDPSTIGVVRRPLGQRALPVIGATEVRVEGLCKVCPVRRNLFLDLVVDRSERVGVSVSVESVGRIHDLGLVESALVLAWGRVGPVVGVKVRRCGLVPVDSVGPRAHKGHIACGGVPGLVGNGLVIVVRVQLEVTLCKVAILERTVVFVLLHSIVGCWRGTRL